MAAATESSGDQRRARKLGDEWRGWDGRAAPADTSAGKRLYVTLTGVLFLLITGTTYVLWYMMAPRLSQWHPRAPEVCLWGVTLVLVLLGCWLALIVLMLWRQRPLVRPFARLARRLIASSERTVLGLGRRLSVSADRAAHSLIRINNVLVRIDQAPTEPARVLILLPRCLTKQQISDARQVAAERGVAIAVVGGGEAARQKILEHRPTTVIGVACERDLISGIRDVGDRLRVLGIPNVRPNGPCKDTCIDLDELRCCVDEAIGAVSGDAPQRQLAS